MEPTAEASKAGVDELSAPTPEGKKRRALLKQGIESTANEFHGLGVEMNQRYESSAVYLADEEPRPPLPRNPVQQQEITTYPGSWLPHAWLNTRLPGKKFSTIDLAGHGAFCLLTGIGGEGWKTAAKQAQELLGVEVRTYSVDWGQGFEDVYFEWTRRNEIEEDGCVLVRPESEDDGVRAGKQARHSPEECFVVVKQAYSDSAEKQIQAQASRSLLVIHVARVMRKYCEHARKPTQPSCSPAPPAPIWFEPNSLALGIEEEGKGLQMDQSPMSAVEVRLGSFP